MKKKILCPQLSVQKLFGASTKAGETPLWDPPPGHQPFFKKKSWLETKHTGARATVLENLASAGAPAGCDWQAWRVELQEASDASLQTVKPQLTQSCRNRRRCHNTKQVIACAQSRAVFNGKKTSCPRTLNEKFIASHIWLEPSWGGGGRIGDIPDWRQTRVRDRVRMRSGWGGREGWQGSGVHAMSPTLFCLSGSGLTAAVAGAVLHGQESFFPAKPLRTFPKAGRGPQMKVSLMISMCTRVMQFFTVPGGGGGGQSTF